MDVKEFRSKIEAGVKLIVEGKEYKVKQVIKFRFDDGDFYIKCFLNNNYVFADDLDNDTFLLVRETRTSIQKPFPKRIVFKDKDFEFFYTAHAVAEEIQGKEIFKKGESETFWDYKTADDSYLSLGIIDSTKQRLDFYGKIIKKENIDIKKAKVDRLDSLQTKIKK
jgi:hypothetical protein